MSKRWLPLLVMTGFIAGLGMAETSRDLAFGLKAGYNSGQLRKVGEDEGGFEVDKFALGGFSVGVFGNLRLSRIFSLQAELFYFAKGGGNEVKVPVAIPGVSIRVKEERRLAYLEIPVTVKFRPPVRWTVIPTFYTGLSAGIDLAGRLESKVHIETPVFPIDLDEEKDLRSELNDLEFSGLLGGGLDIRVGAATIHFDNRFYFGFKPNVFQIVIPMSNFAAYGFPAGPDKVYGLEMLNYGATFTVGVSY